MFSVIRLISVSNANWDNLVPVPDSLSVHVRKNQLDTFLSIRSNSFVTQKYLIFVNHRSNRLGLVWTEQPALVVLRLWLWWFRARVRPRVSCRSYPRGSPSFQDLDSNSCKHHYPTARCSASSSRHYPPLSRPHQAQVWKLNRTNASQNV